MKRASFTPSKKKCSEKNKHLVCPKKEIRRLQNLFSFLFFIIVVCGEVLAVQKVRKKEV